MLADDSSQKVQPQPLLRLPGQAEPQGMAIQRLSFEYVLKNAPIFPCGVSAGHARPLPGERSVNIQQMQTQGLCNPVHLGKSHRNPK